MPTPIPGAPAPFISLASSVSEKASAIGQGLQRLDALQDLAENSTYGNHSDGVVAIAELLRLLVERFSSDYRELRRAIEALERAAAQTIPRAE